MKDSFKLVQPNINRRVKIVSQGLYRIDQEYFTTKPEKGLDVTGPFWVFGFVSVSRGDIYYLQGNDKIKIEHRNFGIFIPPYKIVEIELSKASTANRALFSKIPFKNCSVNEPIIFEISNNEDLPNSISGIDNFLKGVKEYVFVNREIAPNSLARKAKYLIDQSFCLDEKISALARKLNTSPAVLSRYFKKCYGISPQKYRQWLRTMVAMRSLIEGEAIAQVQMDSGYQDLSRFYKQFKQITQSSPGQYKPD